MSLSEVKKLSEVQVLKAQLHKQNLSDLMKTDELHKANLRIRRAFLLDAGAKLEAEFQETMGTTSSFDWNTLKFQQGK